MSVLRASVHWGRVARYCAVGQRPLIRTLFLLLCMTLFAVDTLAEEGWKAGLAKAVITPAEPMWMAGYASRTKPAEGKIHDLWVRVLALEDSKGERCVVVSTDTLGISRIVYENVTRQLKERQRLDPEQIMLNASHTHSGPVIEQTLYDAYPLDTAERERIRAYTRALEETIVKSVESAFDDLSPAIVSAGEGHATFAVNRRNNPEGEVPALRAKGLLKGPFDHSVPVLSVRAPDGNLRGVVFAYACHNTTMDFYEWFGDYAGVAEELLESLDSKPVALFVAGCGADQNPLPRRKLEWARGYGAELASAVTRVLDAPMRTLEPTLDTAIEMIDLKLGDPPTRAELEEIVKGGAAYHKRWAARLLADLDAGQPWITSYSYPLLAWRLGDQIWISMAGEVVVDYDLKFKAKYGPHVWTTSYANDVMAYIPSLRVLKEGGYEGGGSMIVYGFPANRWADDVEDEITAAVDRLVVTISSDAGAK